MLRYLLKYRNNLILCGTDRLLASTSAHSFPGRRSGGQEETASGPPGAQQLQHDRQADGLLPRRQRKRRLRRRFVPRGVAGVRIPSFGSTTESKNSRRQRTDGRVHWTRGLEVVASRPFLWTMSGHLMPSQAPTPSAPPRRLAAVAAIAFATVVLVGAARHQIPPGNVCPDFIQFWTAAKLLGSGLDPYDPGNQASVQRDLGWNKAEEGLGLYDFLPYYYPPWLGLAFLPFLPLGYPLAKMVWLVVGAELLAASGWLLKDTIRGISATVAIVMVAAFGFSIKAVAMGQVAPLVLFLVALAWWLLDRRRDSAAGCVLALLTIKPQLTLLLLLAVLGWAARHERWAVVRTFGVTLAALCIVSTLAWPAWIPSMLAATTVTPMPTRYFPGLGTTWMAALTAVGAGGILLALAYAAVVVPLMLALLRMTLRRGAALEDVFGLALIAPFFVAPYARPYDFPVLLVPALILIGSRLPELTRATMAVALTLLTGMHIVLITASYEVPVVGVRRPEFTYFWIPLMIAAAWLCCGSKGGSEEVSVEPNRPEPTMPVLD